jgi:tripeptide aminopeptidase
MINKKRLIQTFLDLVGIDSPSGEERAVAEYAAKFLRKLGGKVEFDSYGNVIGKFKGEGETMMLNSHLDTVEPGRGIKASVRGDKIVSDGSTILGGDAKAGVAAILEALISLKEDNRQHVPIEVVFTLAEESGLVGATNLDYSKISAKRGITFDGERGVENLTISAPGYNRVDVTIIGRGAHAGAEPEKGISAIKIAAEIIGKLEVGRIDSETTANVGLIEGGSARNAVPERVHFKAEIRSRSLKKLEDHVIHFEEVFKSVMNKYPDAKIELTMQREFDPYIFEESHRVIKQIQDVFKVMKIKPKLEVSGGGTDVNVFHIHGIEAVCVGVGDYEAHTTREYVVVREMVEAAEFCEKLISFI